MRFHNVILEGPDCSGKTKLYEAFNEATGYKYRVTDRSTFSTYIYSVFYGRSDSSFWFDKFYEDLKNLNTLYVVLLPDYTTILERFKKRGDEKHDEASLKKVYDLFYTASNFGVGRDLPNFIILKSENLEEKIKEISNRLDILNNSKASDIVKSLVINSGRNELINIAIKSDVLKEGYDKCALNFPEEQEYYKKIESALIKKVQREFIGLNENNVPQKHDSRRFIFTSDSCISMIHFLLRGNTLDVSATLRSSNVSKTLWADYEFLKYICFIMKQDLELSDEFKIQLTLNIRSAHVVP